MIDIVLKRIGPGPGEVSTNAPYLWHLHSEGFEWGYGGSGPADLALNVLLMFVDRKTAERLHQDFKWKFIASLPKEGGIITESEIKKFLEFDKKYPDPAS